MILQKCECWYCKRYFKPSALWKLKNGVYWFEIPKNGSFTVKKTYRRRQIVEQTDRNKKQIVPHVVSRDPVERFKSLFKHYFLPVGHRFKIGKQFYKKLTKNRLENLAIEDRLDFLIDNIDKLTTTHEVHHFYPQVHFINTSFQLNIFEIGELSTTLNVPRANSTNTSIDVILNDSQLDIIHTLYKADYEFRAKHLQ